MAERSAEGFSAEAAAPQAPMDSQHPELPAPAPVEEPAKLRVAPDFRSNSWSLLFICDLFVIYVYL